MRSVLRLLWMATVLIVVALVSALTAMRFAVHGAEVKVPDLLGKAPGEARARAEQLGLEAQVEREYYSASVPQGRVVSQMPEPGIVVRRGWQLRLALSLGPQRIAIPQVVGESQRAAEINIAQRGLEVAETAWIDLPEATTGQVLGQEPPGNATDAATPKIDLLIAGAAAPQGFVMPNFIGQPLGSVTLALKDAGVAVGKVTLALLQNSADTTSPAPSGQPGPPAATPANNISPASIVVSQNPPAGAKVMAGGSVDFVVR